jgi:hypothetical protein
MVKIIISFSLDFSCSLFVATPFYIPFPSLYLFFIVFNLFLYFQFHVVDLVSMNVIAICNLKQSSSEITDRASGEGGMESRGLTIRRSIEETMRTGNDEDC